MPSLSYLDGFRDRRKVEVQLWFGEIWFQNLFKFIIPCFLIESDLKLRKFLRKFGTVLEKSIDNFLKEYVQKIPREHYCLQADERCSKHFYHMVST